MKTAFHVPHGDELITVQLTVKEAIALGMGEKFHRQPEIAASARSKLKREVTGKLPSYANVDDEAPNVH